MASGFCTGRGRSSCSTIPQRHCRPQWKICHKAVTGLPRAPGQFPRRSFSFQQSDRALLQVQTSSNDASLHSSPVFLDLQSQGQTKERTRFRCGLTGLQLEQEILIISTKASCKLGPRGNNDQRDYVTRPVKNTDKLETMTAVVQDGREVATAHISGKQDLQFTCEA